MPRCLSGRWIQLLAGFAAIVALVAPARAAEPVPLIFDTDIGNDIDDALALAMIHTLESRGECHLLAVTISKDNPYSATFVDLVNTFYGRPDISIGLVHGGVAPQDSRYIRQPSLAQDDGHPRYPHRLADGHSAPEAVALLRRTLAAQKDGSVVMVQVGFSTNLARLLDSPAGADSPLGGSALVRQKVRLLSIMAGSFSPGLAAKRYKEYNVAVDKASATKLFAA